MVSRCFNWVSSVSSVPQDTQCNPTLKSPLLGGSLERPSEKFPTIFGSSIFFKEYPYFLPCFVAATNAALCWLIVAFFLKEVRVVFISVLLDSSSFQTVQVRMSPMEYLRGHLRKHQTDSSAAVEVGAIIEGHASPLSFRELLTAPVLLATGCFASFAILDISFRTMFPVYLATPIKLGGLGLDPPGIGAILAVVGISASVFQLLFFPPLYKRLDEKILFLISMALFFPIAALFPIMSCVAQDQGLNKLVWCLLGLQIFSFSFANFALSKPSNKSFGGSNDERVYVAGVSFVYVNSAAPNRASIGATTGFAQMIVAFVRAIGPSAINSAFALGIQKHVMGGHFAYWMMAGMGAISLGVGAALPRRSIKTQ